jgi:hypothetical protein
MVTVIGREARVEATRSTPPWRRIVADLEAQTLCGVLCLGEISI